jgi:hypothetical protein
MKQSKVKTSKKTALEKKQEEEAKEFERQKELENLQRNLMKKLYADLYMKNIDLYQEKNLTFENFIFYFYRDIEETLDFNNPDYQNLFLKMDLKIKEKFNEENKLNSDLNPREIKNYINKLSREDEWALIYNYKKALHEEEEKRKKIEKEENIKKYHNELENQINFKKNYVDEKEKRNDEIYLYDEKEKKENLEKLKIENLKKIEFLKKNIKNKNILSDYILKLDNENLNLNENNKDLITFKINYLLEINNEEAQNNNEINENLDFIINENKLEKINNIISTIKYHKELKNQIDEQIKRTERPDQMNNEERKFNKDLLNAAREYFNKKHQLNA